VSSQNPTKLSTLRISAEIIFVKTDLSIAAEYFTGKKAQIKNKGSPMKAQALISQMKPVRRMIGWPDSEVDFMIRMIRVMSWMNMNPRVNRT
jgi:hypothetical protein